MASLADYNSGRLHGIWIDATEPIDDVQDKVQRMLTASPEPVAEEYAIHDYEGFGPHGLNEYEPLDHVVRIAHGIETHGEAFAHWANGLGWERRDELERFEDAFLGEWFSLEEYAEQMIEDAGVDADDFGPEWLRPYIRIDFGQLAQALASDLTVSEGRSSVFIFQDW